MSETAAVAAHYARSDLMQRIREALSAAGHDPDAPTVEALAKLDHLHGGGHAATVAQARLAAVPRGAHVLDAGCGVGGPGRYLAAEYGCTVEAVDLTPEYVELSATLNRQVGLDHLITTTVASVTDLPFAEAAFDVVWCQNVTMNVADKTAMFAEAFRVLKPGGTYTFSHMAGGPGGAPHYPLPWAMTEATSFLSTPDEITDLLRRTGFTDIRDHAPGNAPSGPPPTGIVGDEAAMGDDMPARRANAARSSAEGRLTPMLITARRSGGA